MDSQTRKRHNHILQRSNTKTKYVNKITAELGALFNSKIKAPSTLIELSKTEYRRIKDNSIYFEGLLRINGYSKVNLLNIYTNVSYGSKISISQKSGCR